MITASEYRKRSRRTITLPTGGEVEIRKLYGFDFIDAGEIPDAFWEAVKKGNQAAAQKALDSRPGLEEKLTRAMLVNAVVSMNLVDKPLADCGGDEVSIDELDPRDRKAILEATKEMNSMSTEAGKSIGRFQEEPSPACPDGRPGEEVRETPDTDPRPAA
jgi:hypothetical protein